MNDDAHANRKITARIKARFQSPFTRFLVIGFLNTAFAYFAFVALLFAGSSPQTALLVSTCLGIVFSFTTSSNIVFRSAGNWQAFCRFVAVYAASYLLNALLLEMLIQFFKLPPYLAQAMLIPPCAVLNFWLMRIWVFKMQER
jgi:putative flippase GtrA